MSSIKIRTKRFDDITQIRTLIAHPMETGRNKDEQGKLIPAHFIQELTVKHNDNIIASSIMGAGISKNPYFSFKFKGGKPGDIINISWQDNLGQSDSQDKILK